MSRGFTINDFLTDRGLPEPVHPEDQGAEPQRGLPPDYLARVRALELSIESTLMFKQPERPMVLARAMDFLAFLTATPFPERMETEDDV